MPSAEKWLRSCVSKPSRRTPSPQRVTAGNEAEVTLHCELFTARADRWASVRSLVNLVNLVNFRWLGNQLDR